MIVQGEGTGRSEENIDPCRLKDLRGRVETICNAQITKHKSPSRRAKVLLDVMTPRPAKTESRPGLAAAASLQKILITNPGKINMFRIATSPVKLISREMALIEN